MTARQIKVVAILLSIALTIAASALAFSSHSFLNAGLGLVAAFLIGASLLERKKPETDKALFERARSHAEEGRKLAIYDREMGHLAYWYLELRCGEECDRAKRYAYPFTVLVLEPASSADGWTVCERLSAWLTKNARSADSVGYLGNGRFTLLMPYTEEKGCGEFLTRLYAELPGVEDGVSSFPQDGLTLDALIAAAVQQLGSRYANVA